MLKQLQNAFSSFCKFSNEQDIQAINYQWFITKDNEIIGIDKKELTQKDMTILSAFLSPYNIKFPILTEQERIWEKRITETANDEAVSPYRFVYFSIKKNQLEPKLLKEALHDFFTKPVPILWVNEHEGIIIEEQSSLAEENIPYDQIIDILMSDLYLKIKFFVGPYFDSLKYIKQHYNSFVKDANTVFRYSDKPVVTYIDAITYLFIEQADPSFREEITAIVLQEFATDNEFLQMIQTFIQCNLNVTVTEIGRAHV